MVVFFTEKVKMVYFPSVIESTRKILGEGQLSKGLIFLSFELGFWLKWLFLSSFQELAMIRGLC